ncbi:hypothetical protein DI09_43p120 [Mitosporidium daphniae]|uniref:Uncharacterized protein n=1 Tax=Mitosporidium daphniae TaxID=1485682 RepID=A0A098VQ04_9MICR|nr:uncharacterized protein DI09_43p120 [Mitosporidium daphniae]KGG51137.1 hypothetical protein DI09_43p120 [Mitosporidium daphniae]|eukprot:XP_013237564.1 uncharacterized protein DI09_43p120 [Mitosporidium daphniae]
MYASVKSCRYIQVYVWKENPEIGSMSNKLEKLVRDQEDSEISGMFGKMASVFKGNSSSNEYQTKLALYPACELVLYKSKVALRENKL